MKRIAVMTIGVVTAAVCAFSLCAAQTQPAVSPQVSSVMKEVQGEVVWKSKSKLSLVYRSDETSEQEILFILDEPVVVVHRNSLDDIAIGDTVRVVYEEYVQETLQGPVTKTRPVQIVFIRAGTRPPVSAQESSPQIESDVLTSE